MRKHVGVAACRTLSREVSRCCLELGLPAEQYATSYPACLFRAQLEQLPDFIADAGRHHEALLLALGGCCGDIPALAQTHHAAAVSATRCTEMLLGHGTYDWCVERHLLPLPPPYFAEYLVDQDTRSATERAVAEQVAESGIERIGAVSVPTRSASRRGMDRMMRLAQRDARPMYTGLGHLRQIVRRAAVASAIPVAIERPASIAVSDLGPGDQCLMLATPGAPAGDRAAQLIVTSLAHRVDCVWVTGDPSGARSRIADLLPNATALEESGELEIALPEATVASAAARDTPRRLVQHWTDRAVERLDAGRNGLCVIHGSRWAEAADLSSDYVLEYTARLATACARWPLFVALDCDVEREPAHLVDELLRTHPLLWVNGEVTATREYDDDYLGGQEWLESATPEAAQSQCRQMAPLVSAHLDGALDPEAERRVAEHLAQCPTCKALSERARAMKGALRPLRGPVPEAPADLWERIARQIHPPD